MLAFYFCLFVCLHTSHTRQRSPTERARAVSQDRRRTRTSSSEPIPANHYKFPLETQGGSSAGSRIPRLIRTRRPFPYLTGVPTTINLATITGRNPCEAPLFILPSANTLVHRVDSQPFPDDRVLPEDGRRANLRDEPSPQFPPLPFFYSFLPTFGIFSSFTPWQSYIR